MPEEAQAPTDAPEAPPPSAPDDAGGEAEPASGNEWLRDTAQGLLYSRSLTTDKRSDEWAEANAELRRGRRNGRREDGNATEGDGKPGPEPPKEKEPAPSARETDDAAFQRRVQAEVDRREAVRRQRDEAQRERDLRQRDPAEYARYKEQQSQQQSATEELTSALRGIGQQFDEAAVKPLMDALTEADRTAVLDKAKGVHGIPQRKVLAEEGIKALRKASYDEGFSKGKESAQKSLRRSSAFRRELLAEAREGEDEPELALGNGRAGGADWDMNDWMRSMTGRGSRRSSQE